MSRKTIKPLTVLALLAVLAAPLHATEAAASAPVPASVYTPLGNALPLASPAPALVQSVVPAATPPAAGDARVTTAEREAVHLRQSLVGLAMALRHIRYVRGGRIPATGFDCSGFVHYVFAQALGLKLPTNAASQFLAGLRVDRSDMQPGDLVFFRTAGRRGRISHVGIYIDHGQFIHSPSHGQTVRVDSLADTYWARRFAGAKRPEGLAGLDVPPG